MTDPDAARLLTSPRALRFLAPFLRGSASLTTAAKELAVRPSAVAYWLPQFRSADLIERTAVPAGGATNARWYRAPITSFFIPASMITGVAGRDAITDGRRRAIDSFYTALSFKAVGATMSGLTVGLVEDEIQMRAGLPVLSERGRRRSTAVDGWLELRLEDSRALAFKLEILAMVQRYRQAEPSRPRRGRPYLLHFGLTQAP